MKKYLNKRITDISWDFISANTKEMTHCYHVYPAMMIPQIARRLLDEYAPKRKSILFDPYCGTGTSLVEANLQGIENIGTDLNPLARLISKVKNTNYDYKKINKAIVWMEGEFFVAEINGVKNINIPEFSNIDYWFSQNIKENLSFIHSLIAKVDDDIKEFFLIPFSETIREASYTRNSEFKLFRIQKEKLESHNPNVFSMFILKSKRNLNGLNEYNKKVLQSRTNVYEFDTCEAIPNIFDKEIDIIITSPPYGDSKTTVAYGQFSRLTNQWLGFPNANQVDNNLMGGRNNVEHQALDLETVNEDLEYIKEIDKNRYKDVKSFILDYQKSINNISPLVKQNGIVCYVVGNRRVKNRQIQLDTITAELFENNGFEHITTIVRNIPNKRMPSKNSPTNITGELSSTMTNEYIVVLKKK
jgi:tRNA G10  N-methylase Trm11